LLSNDGSGRIPTGGKAVLKAIYLSTKYGFWPVIKKSRTIKWRLMSQAQKI
jgi:hypothetical protein